ncbi:MAG: hypothetical protein JRE70_14170, partial [Deltaproteobacteria bacterium]|nr:hypothetical protein [Deltaproteobacteria bacterium]
MSPFKTHIGYPIETEKPGRAYQSAKVESAGFKDGRRRLERAVIAFQRYDGRTDRFSMEVVSQPLYMQGGGYWSGFDDGLGRGIYRGEDHVEGGVWDVSHPTRVRDRRTLSRNRGARLGVCFAMRADDSHTAE